MDNPTYINFRISLIGECGLRGITEEQIKSLKNFIKAQITAKKIIPEYDLFVETIMKDGNCKDKKGLDLIKRAFNTHILESKYRLYIIII